MCNPNKMGRMFEQFFRMEPGNAGWVWTSPRRSWMSMKGPPQPRVRMRIGQDGDECIQAEEMAQRYGTITNELLSRLCVRLPIVEVESRCCTGRRAAAEGWK